MMSGDCQSQGLAEWLHALGWHERLKQMDLRKLNTPKMRSVWRHLQAQVMRTDVASTIRKNVLLNRLENENIHLGQFRNFKLDSVNQLHKVKEILEIEEEKEKLKEEIRVIDEKLKNEKSSLLQKKIVEVWEQDKLSEIETKTTILDLKLSRLSKDCKKFSLDEETVETLKADKTSTSYNELSHQKYTVSNYVKNYSYPFKDTDDDSEYMCEMMSSILEFKPDNILDGTVRNAKEALKSLHSKIDVTPDLRDETSMMFEEKLRDLKIMVIKNRQKIQKIAQRKILDSNELQKEKEELLKEFIDVYRNNKEETDKGSCQLREINEEVDEDDMNNKHVQLRLNDLLEKIQKERKKKKIWEENNLLISDEDYQTLEDLKLSILTLSAEVNETWKKVEHKVNEFNAVTSTAYSTDLAKVNELIDEIKQVASDFKNETSVYCNKSIDSNEFTDMIYREIEVFQNIPMIALQRKWDTSNEMLRVCSTKRSANDLSLLMFLSQTEEKNIIINVLEKYLWSLYISPQFH
ncbi:serine/threonine-protein kinase MRCK alpha-like [Macrosteles quadrilineatus]|uniref:serine/threonine-protein kinase MRCK alpha-like n=1 Tax=Macrosteles quadrilineatus TaxID=74068 RepID=UPI0023E14696|nr:serine/threonine-protein kinase MRCK alpha-like [Macrosteles quadrilineatus]